MNQIIYPYLPEGREIKYVPADNIFMRHAYTTACSSSLDKAMPGGAVLVKGGVILGEGANGSVWHDNNECQRIVQGCPSGEGYELCEGCHPKNHSEPSAIKSCVEKGGTPENADLYLWGHWWCCEDCWKVMIDSGIRSVYLLEGSEYLFNKNHPNNIVGKQFDEKLNGMKKIPQ